MRIRLGLVGILACALLAGCTGASSEPRPKGTLEPSITESSPTPTANPDNPACDLLSNEERSEVAGYSLSAEIPVRPTRDGTLECIWVHSKNEPARAAIRVMALRGDVWARSLRPQVRGAMLARTTSKQDFKKLEALWKKLGRSGGRLPADEICPSYLMLAEARGAVPDGDTAFYGNLGGMPAAYGMSCEDGNMILAGYGEYGAGPSLALRRSVIRLVAAAKERSTGIFDEIDSDTARSGNDDGEGSPAPDDEATDEADTDEDASPSPEPSPSEDEDES